MEIENEDQALNVSDYAKRICKEIGWPYAGNLTLLCDCISSLGFMKGTGVGGGYFSLLEAVRLARSKGIRVDRWFFQDGRYVEILEEALPPANDPLLSVPPSISGSIKPN